MWRARCLSLNRRGRVRVEQSIVSHSPSEVSESETVTSLEAEVRTFLIADVRGYTSFTQEHGDEAGARLAARFAEIARQGVTENRGSVIELRGDEALAVFGSARQALRSAVSLQERFAQEAEGDSLLPLKVGIGLDAGEAVRVEGGYRGGALNLAARLCNLARPGEVLASETVVHLARKVTGLTYIDRGSVKLKGLEEPVRVVQIVRAGQGPISGDLAPLISDVTPIGDMRRLPVGGFLGAVPEAPLIAREEQVSRLLPILASVANGGGALVLLAGEPGIGKTRLAQEVMVEAHKRGFLIATSSCYEQRQAIPFYPFIEMLTALYSAAPAELAADTPQRWPLLAHLVPEVPAPTAAVVLTDQEEQERLFRTVADFIRALAATAPMSLMIDDLQWADVSSLDLLQYLARHTRAARVLLVATYRDTEVDSQHPLDSALLDLSRQQLIDAVPVKGLDAVQTADLIAATVGGPIRAPDVVDLVHRRTQGNPFFIQEVVRSLVERGDVYRRDGHWAGRSVREIHVPARVRSVIGQRLAGLAPATREILQQASVLGQTFLFDDLCRMIELPEGEVENALEVAEAAGILREVDSDRMAFSHPLTRQTLYEELGGRKRRRLHLAAGEALERRNSERAGDRPGGDIAAELAWHFLQADEPKRALTYAIQAGDAAERLFAHSEAARQYKIALDVSQDDGDTARQADILEKLGSVLQILGQYDEALEYFERAAQSYEAVGDMEGERRSVASAGLVLAALGKPETGLARLEPQLDRMGSKVPPSRGVAMLYVAKAQLLAVMRQPDQSLVAATRGARAARAIHDDRILAEAEVRGAEALAVLGHHQDARRVLEEVVPLAERGNLGTLGRALIGLGTMMMLAGDFEQARAYHQRALEMAERFGEPRSVAISALSLGRDLLLLGDWRQAGILLDRAIDVSDSIGTSWVGAVARITLGHLSLYQGVWDEGIRHAEAGRAMGGTLGEKQVELYAQYVLADHDLTLERPKSAIERLTPFLDTFTLEPLDLPDVLLVVARAHIQLSDVASAERMVLEGITKATAVRNRPALVAGLRVQGNLRAAQGRLEEALNVYAAALSSARSMKYPLEEGRILFETAIALGRTGDVAAASLYLEQSLAIFQRLGAQPLAERVERALGLLAG